MRLDPLQGGAVREGRVERVDHSHDLAVVVTNKPLAESVAGLAPTDEVPQATPVAVTGVAIITDPGHSYRHLDTNGHWAGGTTRDDQIQLGRIVVEALMKGMSGAPVLSGNFAVGIVSARYNSADEWARNSVWVARTEDLTPLLSGLDDIVAPQSGNAEPTENGIMIGHARAAPSVESQGRPDIIGDGVFIVGLDIKPGVYRTAGPVSGRSGYYALLSSTNTSDIINNNNIDGRATITVGPDVKAVSVSHCQPWFWQGASLDEAIASVRREPQNEEVLGSAMGGDGVFIVGLDIKPGVYRTAGPVSERSGYYALLSSTNTSDIINNNNIDGPATITVGPDVKAVSVSHCQPWFWQGASLDEAIAAAREKAADTERARTTVPRGQGSLRDRLVDSFSGRCPPRYRRTSCISYAISCPRLEVLLPGCGRVMRRPETRSKYIQSLPIRDMCRPTWFVRHRRTPTAPAPDSRAHNLANRHRRFALRPVQAVPQ